VRWQGKLWCILRSDGPTPIAFYDMSTGEERVPSPPIYETVGNGYAYAQALSNGNLALWLGARTKPPGDFYVLNQSFAVLSHGVATGSGTQAVGNVGGLPSTLCYVNEQNATLCTHDLQVFRGQDSGAVEAGPIETLPRGHSTCIHVFTPQCGFVEGADGKLYVTAVRDSNSKGYADGLRIDPTTLAVEKRYPSWLLVGGEIPPVHMARIGAQLVIATTNNTAITGTPFNLAKHPTLFIGANFDALAEYVNPSWQSCYAENMVASNDKGEPLVLMTVWNGTNDNTTLNLWRLRGGQYQLCYTAPISAQISIRGIWQDGVSTWVAYGKPDNTCVAVELSEQPVVPPPTPPKTLTLVETIQCPQGLVEFGEQGNSLFVMNGEVHVILGSDANGANRAFYAYNLTTKTGFYIGGTTNPEWTGGAPIAIGTDDGRFALFRTYFGRATHKVFDNTGKLLFSEAFGNPASTVRCPVGMDARVIDGKVYFFYQLTGPEPYPATVNWDTWGVAVGDFGGALSAHEPYTLPPGVSTAIFSNATKGCIAKHPVSGQLYCVMNRDSSKKNDLQILNPSTFALEFTAKNAAGDAEWMTKYGEHPAVAVVTTTKQIVVATAVSPTSGAGLRSTPCLYLVDSPTQTKFLMPPELSDHSGNYTPIFAAILDDVPYVTSQVLEPTSGYDDLLKIWRPAGDQLETVFSDLCTAFRNGSIRGLFSHGGKLYLHYKPAGSSLSTVKVFRHI
jgi:hypothetical protein